jgi:methyl-accepting chemotaxis protein
MFKQVSIKWKILAVALAGPLIVAAIMAFQRVDDIREGAHEAILDESRAIVLMAEAAREEMSKKLELGVIRPFEEIPRENVVQAVPVITAINMARVNAEEGGYRFRVPKVNPRNAVNEPTAMEREILAELKSRNLDEKIVFEDNQIRYFRPIRLTPECLYCHGEPKGAPDAVGGTKEGWKVGEIHGAFEIITSLDSAKARVAQARVSVLGWTAAILALLSAAAWVLTRRSIISPLTGIQDYAGEVAAGNLEARPRGVFGAELGRVRTAIETMVANLKGKMAEAEERSTEAASQAQRAEQAMESAKSQEERATTLLATMTRIAQESSGIATNLADAADALAAQVEEVSRGAEQQSQRTGETATAMEEMNATVLEVARNSSSAAESADNARTKAMEGADIVKQAVEAINNVYQKAQDLKADMTELGEQAEGINRIMDVISDIADQTNLLALNAAIEAARAGEAGRGFAVVADEVRKLAEKTMDATKEVGRAIQSIQQGARKNIDSVEDAARAIDEATTHSSASGDALTEIVSLANDTSDQVRSIATAAEEQSAASEEINRAVEDISRIAGETSDGMNQSAVAVEKLAELAQKLQGLIDEMVQE